MRLNGLTPYLILVALGALLITSLACDQIAGYDRATYGPLASGYYCQAEIFRGLDPQHAFVEQWLATVYPKALETGDGLCRLRLQQYIAKAMSPYFYWETRNVTSIPLVEGQKAVDCAPQDPGNGDPIPDPTGPNEIPPASYGGPLGALVTWFPPNDGDGFVPENLASVTLTLKNSDGTVKETATPRVKYAGLVIAERQGALNGLLTDAQYDPTKRHLRVSDFVIQLESPFDFAGLHVNNLYIKNVGTLLSESGMGPNRYVFLTEPLRSASPVPSKAKFYFHAIGESDGHSALDSRCFVNSDSTLGGTSDAITFTQEPSGPIFSLAFNIQDVGDAPLDIQIKLISPADTLFTQHQPWVSIPDIETSETQVDLSVIKENGELRVYDHDGIASPKIQWFEDFEQPGERFIGEGLEIPNVPFSPGAHRVTVVVFDENGTYNYDTFTVNVAAPPEASNDGYETDEDVILNISAPGVLGNDTDSNGDLLSAILVSRPSHGDVDLSEDGSFTYTPAENFNGSDSFTYKANDGSQDSNVATVTITVNPVNDPPVAIDDAYTTYEDTALTLGAPGVLSNDQRRGRRSANGCAGQRSLTRHTESRP